MTAGSAAWTADVLDTAADVLTTNPRIDAVIFLREWAAKLREKEDQ